MEGLTIRKKVTPQAKPSSLSVSEAIFSGILLLLFVGPILLLLLSLLLSFIWHKIFPEKPTVSAAPRPVVMHDVPNDFFSLRYQYVMREEISEGAAGCFDADEPLIRYQPTADTDFFKGYFSDFKIEYPTGIFVQKVNFDATLTEVLSMPLCFFNYATKEAAELIDLKGYNLYTKGLLNHFIITATAQDDSAEEFSTKEFELEITLTDALYSPPQAY